ncbi:unnamed protein product [Leptidea sinapis]|uniref:Major facilitator superfamily (MFS) profile domain-containing protein n=1 Tax=Leptidea sinapis TaxID=189913 RepID=A0A5E4QCX0_9NEOP|nr:unnamed protein product [Leptidea sinapis]
MPSQKNVDEPSITRTRNVASQVLACLALDFLLIGLGMSISFVTMVLPDVLNAKEGLSLNKMQASWFGSMAFLCQPLGSIFSGPLMDHFGRKKALFLVNIPHLIAWMLMYFAWNVPSLFIGNALLGIGTGIMEAPSVTYVPESPIWLLSKGRQKEALHSLCRLRGWAQPEDVKEEFDQLMQYNDVIQQCVICVKEGKSDIEPCEHNECNIFKRIIQKFRHVFFVKETMRPFSLVMAYFFFHTMSGLLPVRPNMVNVCRALGMKYDPKIITCLRPHKSSRRCVLLRIKHIPEPERYPTSSPVHNDGIIQSRGMATSLAAAGGYVIFFIATKTNYNLEANFHLSGTFSFYGILGIVGTFYLYFFLPETENKTLIEIEGYYKGNQRIFADDFLINAFRKKRCASNDVDKPMLVR